MKNMCIKQLVILFISASLSLTSLGQTPCVDGFAGDFPCDSIDLLARVLPNELLAEYDGLWLNDIWGWTDPDTGKEYAIVGMANGTSFVDISNPLSPIVLGILEEHGNNSLSKWRDIKTYKNHAFIVSEDADHGMQVFDLTRLRNVENPPEVFTEDAHYDEISTCHNIAINEESGYAYLLGVRYGKSCANGGLHIVDINDPKFPTFAGCFALEIPDNYVHDAHCVIYNGPDEQYRGKSLCFNACEESFQIVDVSNSSSPSLLSIATYDSATYSHQGWLTEDHRYYLSTDELDEIYQGYNTRILIWDIQDLDNPVYIDSYYSDYDAIDHNIYVNGDYAFLSNYTAGLRIFSTSDLTEGTLQEVGYFDTHPPDNDVSFAGSWSNYPFFESGTIAISDRSFGLFLVRPTFLVTDTNDLVTNKLVVYPNPSQAQSKLTLYLEVPEGNEEVELELWSYNGQSLLQTSKSLLSNRTTLDIHGLEKGVYWLRILSNNNLYSQAIIIE